MKLSVNWIFEHIDFEKSDLAKLDIKKLINQLSLKSVEVDGLSCIDIDLEKFTLAQVKFIDKLKNNAVLYSSEFNKEFVINLDQDIDLNSIYLIKEGRRATLKDVGAENSKNLRLFPAISIDEKDLLNWKKDFENKDYIIEIPNIAITNRPDLWGHRGFAREFAAILNKKLIDIKDIFIEKEIYFNDKNYLENNFSLEINNEESKSVNYIFPCRRLAGLYFKEIENKSSILKLAVRLSRLDFRPINSIVDLTNYVMLDLSQPLHAFDADTIKSKKIVSRFAFDKEKIELIDGSIIELNDKDYVITDSKEPIALAGIMGGYKTSISKSTKSVFLESANFDPFVIRSSSIKHKIRTEASSRFEKDLDPNQNIDAILRFLKLLNENNINYKEDKYILSLGKSFEKKVIKISYKFILDKLGVKTEELTRENIKDILLKLDFDLKLEEDNFIVVVGTNRSTKDITIKEDILKEITRFFYTNIKPELPERKSKEFDISGIIQRRKIKEYMAYGANMHEVETYPFFDQEFLNYISYVPEDYLELKNPHSENYKILVTTLIPNLLKVVSINLDKFENLDFFELNRIWFKQYANTDNNPLDFISVELLSLAGIFFEINPESDFYDYKYKLNSLFNLLSIEDDISWKKFKDKDIKFCDKLYDCLKSAEIFYKDRSIGVLGKIKDQFLSNIGKGTAYAFELDANFLINLKEKNKEFKPISKYPSSNFDVSLLIDQNIEVKFILDKIKEVSDKIKEVDLIDIFYKQEWNKEKSLTFRLKILDVNKTMVKEEISDLHLKVIKKLEEIGAKIR